MSGTGLRNTLYLVLLAFFVLHNDLWLWNDGRLLLGFPIGLTYHAIFCLATAILMALLVRYAWPSHLHDDDGQDAGAAQP